MRLSIVLLVLTALACVHQSDGLRVLIRRLVRRIFGLTKKSIENFDGDLSAQTIAKQLRDVGHDLNEEARALDLLTMVLKRNVEDQD